MANKIYNVQVSPSSTKRREDNRWCHVHNCESQKI